MKIQKGSHINGKLPFLICSLPPLMKALRWMVCYSLAGWFVNRKGIGARRGRWLERKGRLKAGDGLVKRRHIHVGAPDNRIGGLYLKSLSWRPGAKTWTRNLDSVVAASPERRLSYLLGWGNGILCWLGKVGFYDGIPRLWWIISDFNFSRRAARSGADPAHGGWRRRPAENPLLINSGTYNGQLFNPAFPDF